MKITAIFIFTFIAVHIHAQNFKAVVDRIYTIEEAKDYASRERGVDFSIVNYENNVFLFDNVDTTDLKKSIGETATMLGRNTKFIKDTVIRAAKIHSIYFDLSNTSREIAELLLNQINKSLDNGDTFWQLKMRYNHTPAIFTTGPVTTDVVEKKYNLNIESFENNECYSIDNIPNVIGVVLVINKAHDVPAFYSISYNIAH